MKSIAKKISFITALSFIVTFSANAQDGATLFKLKCAACHTVGTNKLVGPGLAGINEKRSQEWLITWIKDAPAMIAAGDADAIAVFEEFNKLPMIPFPGMTDADVIAILAYIDGESSGGDAVATEEPAEPVAPIEYAAEDFEAGKLLFTGEKRFVNRGPSCITCHNVSHDDVMIGGLLAKDLTNAYGRLGDATIAAYLNVPPFPAMANAYSSNELTEDEKRQLMAFFKVVDEVSETQKKRSGYKLMAGGGFFGLIIILGLISILWGVRKKESTKKDIFARQLKGNDSVES